MSPIFRWTRLIPSKWEDAWLERLHGEPSTVVTTLAGSKSARLDVYCSYQKAQALLKNFQGKVLAVHDSQWKPALEGTSKPICIRRKIVIYGEKAAFDAHSHLAIPLFFPAEMAFGSGAHVTTAACLRILCDLQPLLQPEWTMLDLGTGSGILAITAGALGAQNVLAVDFDPIAIRIARRNLRRNRPVMKKGKIPLFSVMDIQKNFPVGRYRLIASNLFSELLIKMSTHVFNSLDNGGWWIFSGILVDQMPEITASICKVGFSEPVIRHRGKWIAGFAQKPLT